MFKLCNPDILPMRYVYPRHPPMENDRDPPPMENDRDPPPMESQSTPTSEIVDPAEEISH